MYIPTNYNRKKPPHKRRLREVISIYIKTFSVIVFRRKGRPAPAVRNSSSLDCDFIIYAQCERIMTDLFGKSEIIYRHCENVLKKGKSPRKNEGIYSVNYSAAHNNITIIENHTLTGGNGSLGLKKFHPYIAVFKGINGAGLFNLLVSCFRLAFDRLGKFGD